MAVTRPIKLTLTNYPEGQSETFIAENNPERPEDGTREITFSQHLWIEEEDFMEEPARKYFRLFPGNEVRLKHAYVIKCTGCVKDENGKVVEVLAEYDPASRGGNVADGRKIKGTIHFVDQATAINAELRLYDRLFTVEDPDATEDSYLETINKDSLDVLTDAKLEASLAAARIGQAFQFMRMGYFTLDRVHSRPDSLVFNRTVTLKDSYKVPK